MTRLPSLGKKGRASPERWGFPGTTTKDTTMRKLMIASCALACCAAMTTDPALAATDGNNDGGDSGSLGVCSISDGMAHGGSSGKTGGGQVVISDGAASGHISDLPSKDDIGLGAIADSAWPIVVNSGH